MQTETQTAQTDGARQWLSASAASLRLGTSARTVRRLCASGELCARRVGSVWQVNLDTSVGEAATQTEPDKSAKSRTVGQVGHDRADTDLSVKPEKSDTNAAKSDTDLTAHLLAEVAFLRATVEQLQRDGAETRAALRAALKLSAGESAPQLMQGTPEQSPEAKAPKSASVSERSQQTPASAQESAPIDYNAIADEIENRLNGAN
jgi:hypothetical protein